ncbi:hypothetical protein B0H17DRAFT_1149699 [Mycena rosella]|uniref:CxC1-like cysteine cluster associated with KDZ transposases domain-containing protein n=1 Tax=Mycena rosella TaxID=1033263 RepID=A0AAD7C071_MYCRO|nr:hypothetical protein B0H17DRAFT_1149699 [Mycena rosella]
MNEHLAEDARNDLHTLDHGFDDSGDTFADVLDGTALADISNTGEDTLRRREDLEEEELWEDLRTSHAHLYGKRRDYRTRKDRTQHLVNAFQLQMESIADAYMAWDLRSSAEDMGTPAPLAEDAMVQGTLPVVVVDLFSVRMVEVPMLAGDAFVASGLVNQGYFPCSPDVPSVVLVPFHPYLSTQFSTAFDLYLATLAVVEQSIKVVLSRDEPDWHLKNACPACFYKLEGEPILDLPNLACQDGNNSLKRFGRQERTDDGSTGNSKERSDDRQVPNNYYLPEAEVNKWGKDELDNLLKGFTPDPAWDEEDGCSDCWQNMREEVTAKAWGMYEEMGLFLSLCRHGFVLMVCDMIRSGELAKYGYAVVHHLVKVLHEMAVGYDIGCKFGNMVNAHPVLGPLARKNHFKSLVGAFHGHGHCRLCQLSHLATYVKGVGLDDLEYCETFFSKSNALAASTRYASSFHRKQAIATYLQHTLTGWPPRRPSRHTKRTQNVLAINIPPLPADPLATNYMEEAKATRRLKTQRRHATELYEKVLLAVQELERQMAIAIWWLPESEEWKAAAIMVGWRYQRALDELQGLIISRMFELTKMNMSGTGYKLRKHIAKALQARSSAVKTALTNYNLAAARLRPLRAPMTWEQVVDYAFLSDFNLLQDGREDIREEPWAKPAGRLAMDMYFKLEQATEEIEQLNLEIPRFLTYMRDEEDFLCREVVRICDKDGDALAHQGRFNDVHRKRLWKLARVPGFSASMQTGTPVNKDRVRGQQGAPAAPAPLASAAYIADNSDSDSKDEVDVLAQKFVLLSVMEDIGGGAQADRDIVEECIINDVAEPSERSGGGADGVGARPDGGKRKGRDTASSASPTAAGMITVIGSAA